MRFRALLLILLLFPTLTLSQTYNAGFVQGLWYSDKEVFADTPVRIYVAIRNNTGADLTGRVEFFDNDTRIARNDVSALDGRIIESWADWTPSYGNHTITAKLSRIELHQVGSSTKVIEITAAVAEDIIFVDFDTDNDGVGNEADADDDGDGISDTVEKTNGTDPLVYDEPAPEPTEETDDNNEETSEAADAPVTNNSPSADGAASAGLEQFLTPSPARTALTNITEFVAVSKRNLDTYRSNRQTEITEKENPPEIEVNDDGFGEITRSTETEREIRTPEVKEGGFIASLFSAIRSIFNVLYTTLLAALSFFLSKAIFLQLALLLLILFGVYKLARKFGERKS